MTAPHRHSISLLLAAALAAACAGAHGQSITQADSDPAEDPFMAEVGYMELHPDVEYRQLAMQSHRRGHYQTALEHFRRAGFFGDKPSQGLAAEMYWKGEGTPADRALAYVWMDMAAERGYRDLVSLRERYWAAMTLEERKRALELGPALYKVYGDPTVKPRYERRLTRLRNQITGSHIGVDVGVGASAGNEGMFQEQSKVGGLYARANWDAKQYWVRQDTFWQRRFGGTVNVGDIETLSQGEPGAEKLRPAAEAQTKPAPKPAPEPTP
jgi:TPR repeat protein